MEGWKGGQGREEGNREKEAEGGGKGGEGKGRGGKSAPPTSSPLQ